MTRGGPHLPWVVAALSAAVTVLGFGTVNQQSEHEMITRVAVGCPEGQKSDGVCFEPLTLDQLAGTHDSDTGEGTYGGAGAPDNPPEGPEAHCDDADFFQVGGYPQTRQEATDRLLGCVNHLRMRFREGLEDAEAMLSSDGKKVSLLETDLVGGCSFTFRADRAKCNVLEGIGRSLHGIQDFYSHSNWADSANETVPIGITNPEGLAHRDAFPLFDLREDQGGDIISYEVPRALTTGCWVPEDTTPGSGHCAGRITHDALNKDEGFITLEGGGGPTGAKPVSPRLWVPGNFEKAANLAIIDTRNNWQNFRSGLVARYGSERGELMICALVRDDPVHDCENVELPLLCDDNNTLPCDSSKPLLSLVGAQVPMLGSVG